jgi:hypothetical protein
MGNAVWILALVGAILSFAGFLPDVKNTLGFDAAYLKAMGILLFLGTIVVAIKETAKALTQVTDVVARLKGLELGLEALSDELEYGRSLHRVLDLARTGKHGAREVYHPARAAAESLVKAAEHHKSLSSEVKRWHDGQLEKLAFAESFMISDLLCRLLERLPSGTVWFGVTKLVSGWSSAADPRFANFIKQLQEKTYNETIHIFRVYCGSPNQAEELKKAMQEHQGNSRIHARCLIVEKPDSYADVSLLVQLEGNQIRTLCNTENVGACLKGDVARPICGMEFQVIGGAILESVQLIGADTPRFKQLASDFCGVWRAANPNGVRNA